MHSVISLLLQSRKFWWYSLLTFSTLLYDVLMTSYCYQRYIECLVTALCSRWTVRQHIARVELLRQETPNFLAPNLWPPNSPDLNSVDYKIWVVVYDKHIHSVLVLNWNGSMVHRCLAGAVLDSQFLTRLLTSGEEDIERVSMLKEDISSTACELTMLILSISVTFNVTCLTVTFLITTSCQQRWLIHSSLFYKVMH